MSLEIIFKFIENNNITLKLFLFLTYDDANLSSTNNYFKVATDHAADDPTPENCMLQHYSGLITDISIKLISGPEFDSNNNVADPTVNVLACDQDGIRQYFCG